MTRREEINLSLERSVVRMLAGPPWFVRWYLSRRIRRLYAERDAIDAGAA